MSNCQQNIGDYALCHCSLNWFQANVSQSRFAQDLVAIIQFEQDGSSNAPPDMTKAFVECST